MTPERIIADLLAPMEDATPDPDTAWDFEMAMEQAEEHLYDNGWTRNGVDGSWMKEGED